MGDVRRLVPILTGRHRYDSSLSLRGRAPGTVIEAPILAYLIETAQGRVLYDVGCDYQKQADPILRETHYGRLQSTRDSLTASEQLNRRDNLSSERPAPLRTGESGPAPVR